MRAKLHPYTLRRGILQFSDEPPLDIDRIMGLLWESERRIKVEVLCRISGIDGDRVREFRVSCEFEMGVAVDG